MRRRNARDEMFEALLGALDERLASCGEQRSAGSTVDLEVISHRVTEGSPLLLQLVATSTLYLEPRLGGRIEVSEAAIEVPTATGYRAG